MPRSRIDFLLKEDKLLDDAPGHCFMVCYVGSDDTILQAFSYGSCVVVCVAEFIDVGHSPPTAGDNFTLEFGIATTVA